MRRLMLIAASLIAGCSPPDRDFAEAYEPEMVEYPSPPQVIVEAPPLIVPAALHDGFYNCGDACALASLGACVDLQAHCGIDCGVAAPIDLVVDDACALYGLEFVVTAYQVGDDCAPAVWTRASGVCGGKLAGYCCTADGSPIGE